MRKRTGGERKVNNTLFCVVCGLLLILKRSLEHPLHPSYNAAGGYLRDQAIMILRRFYVTENINGPLLFTHPCCRF